MIDYTTWTEIELTHKRADLRATRGRLMAKGSPARTLEGIEAQIARINVEFERRGAMDHIAQATSG